MEGKKERLPEDILSAGNRSNNEWQEVSKGRSSED